MDGYLVLKARSVVYIDRYAWIDFEGSPHFPILVASLARKIPRRTRRPCSSSLFSLLSPPSPSQFFPSPSNQLQLPPGPAFLPPAPEDAPEIHSLPHRPLTPPRRTRARRPPPPLLPCLAWKRRKHRPALRLGILLEIRMNQHGGRRGAVGGV